ncbi:MAG: glycosyltransferase [Planctomycetia bacterium]|nr:glycosyltransferase [Planctomycetia bacterium]
MDLVADMLLEHLSDEDPIVAAADITPSFHSLCGRIPGFARAKAGRNFDRLWNRFVTLPRAVRRSRTDFDAFHIVDHSYAHVVHELPSNRTGVYCHDLDTFRCLLEPHKDPRPLWFRAMARRILSGLSKAAIVFHSTLFIGEELRSKKLVSPDRLKHVPFGVAPEFTPRLGSSASRPTRDFGSRPFLLHVGSCIPRKRIDLLLAMFAQIHRKFPDLLLTKVGDPWTEAQERQIHELGISDSIRHLGRLSRPDLAEAIRSAAAVVIPSDAEGFGLPVIEALACGVAVVASDLPMLREAGGDVAAYAKAGDLDAWTEVTAAVLSAGVDSAERERRLAWASQFTWQRHACAIATAYRELIERR